VKTVASLLLALAGAAARADDAPAARWWSDPVEASAVRAGKNRDEIERALRECPEAHRGSLAFLIENMPAPDLEVLKADFLLENVALALRARHRVPWGASLPEEVFLNDVLPHAFLNERREPWRREIYEKALAIVEGAKSPAEAAHALNQKLFPLLGVRYSTARRRADQGPLETIESGLASCTGLSILLAAACRAAAVPARIAAIPSWPNKPGNHTWVEVWDGRWRFAGAAEPDPRGLDHAWFEHDASLAVADSRDHAIYASSFRRTDLRFPIVWARGVDWVNAVNVTARYARSPAPGVAAGPRLLVRVRDAASGKRIEADVEVAGRGEPGGILRGTSRGESADRNDILAFGLEPGRSYDVRVRGRGAAVTREHRAAAGGERTIDVVLDGAGAPALDPAAEGALRETARRYLDAGEEERKGFRFAPELEAALAGNEPAARAVVWDVYRAAPLHDTLREDFKARRVRHGGRESPYTLRAVGEKPPGGWALFIALHGGGGTRKEVNDSQWRVMERYYRDQPDLPGYLYLALRAPNDLWNGFYDDYVYPLVETLIRQLVVCEDVDPDRVFIMGYSHGGYGAFAIGPKIPHRFAAVHSSAAAPTDGETSARTLKSTVFTFMIGENDRAYGRIDRCRAFDEAVRALRGDRTDIYPVSMDLKPGLGHGGLPDRDKVRDMRGAARNPVPREVSWEMTDGVVGDFFWLSDRRPAKKRRIEAECRDNRITVRTNGSAAFRILLDGRLVDLSRPVAIAAGGRTSTVEPKPSLRTLLDTLLERGDIGLAFSVAVDVPAREREF
jgi:transglutaminase-like putative cysteine protease/predicted esterase